MLPSNAKARAGGRFGRLGLLGAGLIALEASIALEQRSFGMMFATSDQREGMAAFLGKRPAQFKGK